MERSTWHNTKSLPLNSPRPSGLLATSQTHWASWAQCWEDTPPELCRSSSSHTAAKCGETSPPAGRQENSWVKHYPSATIAKQNNVNYITVTWRVFPSPMQWARIQPEPPDFSTFLTDSQQQSHMNCTPANRRKTHKTITYWVFFHLSSIYKRT